MQRRIQPAPHHWFSHRGGESARQLKPDMEVISLSPHHLSEAAQVLLDAFYTDPSVLAMFEGLDEAEQRRRLLLYFRAALASCLRCGWVLEVRDQGRTVAAGTIYPPQSYPLPGFEQARVLYDGFLRAGVFNRATWTVLQRITQSFSEEEKEHPDRPHYYLEWVGVLPGCQGRGHGTALIDTVLRRANQEGVGCYLETENSRTLPLYQRLGFQVFGHREIMGVPTWFLWREPN